LWINQTHSLLEAPNLVVHTIPQASGQKFGVINGLGEPYELQNVEVRGGVWGGGSLEKFPLKKPSPKNIGNSSYSEKKHVASFLLFK